MFSPPGISQFDQSMFAIFGLFDILQWIGVNVQQSESFEFFLSNEIVATHGTHQKALSASIAQLRPEFLVIDILVVGIVRTTENQRFARTTRDRRQSFATTPSNDRFVTAVQFRQGFLNQGHLEKELHSLTSNERNDPDPELFPVGLRIGKTFLCGTRKTIIDEHLGPFSV